MPQYTAHQLALPLHGVFAEAAPHSTREQRWYAGRHSWRRPEDGGFRPERYRVRPITESVAKAYCLEYHYAKSYPNAVHRYGMFLADEPEDTGLVGVAVFGIPVRAEVLRNPLPALAPIRESLELSRFVLEGEALRPGAPGGRAPANSESWFLANALRMLSQQGIRAVVAFCDPVARVVDGRTLWPGHIGTIYQASNAVYLGRGTARALIVLPDGSAFSDRAVSKIRRQEQGHEYAERRLIALGASPRIGGPANAAAWLRDALDRVGAVRLAHPGNHRFVLATSRAHRRNLRLGFTVLPYPKGTTDPH